MISQLDRASSREGPNANAPREDGDGLREIVDGDLERAEMAAGVSDLSFRHRKIGRSRRRDGRRRFDQHGDVEMVLEQVAGFDGNLVAAADRE